MVLSDKQRRDLNIAIGAYLRDSGYTGALSALLDEASLTEDDKTKTPQLLEKKWTSVVRLQKKVMDLEAKLGAAVAELAEAPASRRKANTSDWIIRPPADKTLTAHRLPVTKVLLHPTYTVLVTASEDATVKVWDFESGDFERTLKGHTNVINDLAFDKGGQILASCSGDFTIKLWDVQVWECIKTLKGQDHNISSVVFTPSGDHLLSSSRDKTIRQWETSTGYCTKTYSGHDEWVRSVAVSDDGAVIASCSNDQSVRIWDFLSGECKAEMKDHDHVVEAVAFANEAALPYLSQAANAQGPQASSTSSYVVSCGRDKLIKVWYVPSQEIIFNLAGHDNWVRGVCFHPNGKFIVSASDDRTIRFWDLSQSGRNLKTVEAHEHFVTSIAVHNKLPLICSASVDKTVKIWKCN